jgi:hypothetical protein
MVAGYLPELLQSVQQVSTIPHAVKGSYRGQLDDLLQKQLEIARHSGERNGPYTTSVSCTPAVVVQARRGL